MSVPLSLSVMSVCGVVGVEGGYENLFYLSPWPASGGGGRRLSIWRVEFEGNGKEGVMPWQGSLRKRSVTGGLKSWSSSLGGQE